jgi:hypothetical protein
MERILPTGKQDFIGIRETGFIYVDKTDLIYKLAKYPKPYFFSRPRRFGKSLLCSTLQAYFEGKRELFEEIRDASGEVISPRLAIADLEKDWQAYPVLHFPMNISSWSNAEETRNSLGGMVGRFEEIYGETTTNISPASRFESVIRAAYTKTGKKVVVIIDEYDKPLTDNLLKEGIFEEVQEEIANFYGILKSCDAYLRFMFITGITKFSKVSIFSKLNQLIDITLDEKYACLCGITEKELENNFVPELHALAKRHRMTYDDTLEKVRHLYNGYHFTPSDNEEGISEGVYNPFGLLNTFEANDFLYSWFESGIPAFLPKLLKKYNFDLRKFEGKIDIFLRTLQNYRPNDPDPMPLLFQTGFLTINKYDYQVHKFDAGFPNDEVRFSLLHLSLPEYTGMRPDPKGLSVDDFYTDLKSADVDSFMTRLTAFFADIPYGNWNKKDEKLYDKLLEQHFQVLLYAVFTLMGEYVTAEEHSSLGRADLIADINGIVFCFEFKLSGNGTADDALKQIENNAYLSPYLASGKKLVKVGVVFDRTTHTVGEWKVVD